MIPARYASSRFPGKPLAKICGQEMIVRVCRQVAKTGFELAVATDDPRIADTVTKAGFKAVMTGVNHRSGTERIEEAYRLLGSEADFVINVQGDEPFISPEQILAVADIFRTHPEAELATLTRPYPKDGPVSGLKDPNLVKLVKSETGEALYFSRSVIPYLRGIDEEEWPAKHQYYSHIGIYGYSSSALERIVSLSPVPLEEAESLEQLRWLGHGMHIHVAVSTQPTIGIDTPADLAEAERYLLNN